MSITPFTHTPNLFFDTYDYYDIKKSNNPYFPNVKKGVCSSCISITHCVPPISKTQHNEELKKIFIERTEHSLNSSKKFLGSKSWVNDTNWTMGKIERDLPQEWKDRYIKVLQVWKEIEYETMEEGLIPVFFTGTVIGDLHPFKAGTETRKAEWHIKNLNKAYLELQDLHTQIRKQASRTLGYSPLFIRAVEYHKSFVPHTHIVYWVKPNDLESFLTIIKNKEELNKNIGRTETKVLKTYDPKDKKSPVSYLLKYLKKNIDQLTKKNNKIDEKSLEIFNGWKNTLKIKQLYNNSLYRLPKWAISKISYHFKDFAEKGYRSMLEAIEDNVYIENESIQLDKSIKKRIVNNCPNPTFTIYRKIEKYNYFNEEDNEIMTADKVIEYIIHKEDKKIFDKSEYQLIEDRELSRYQELTKEEKLKIFQMKQFLSSEKLYDFLYSKIDYEEINNVDYGIDFIETAQHLEYDILPFGCA
jgi:hypothetical protein